MGSGGESWPDDGGPVRVTIRRPHARHGPAHGIASVVTVLVVLAGCQSCGSSTSTSSTTTTTAAGSVAAVVAGGGSGSGEGGAAPPASAAPATPVPTTNPVTVATTEPETTTVPSELYFGSYDVKQIITLGHETISGTVCDVRRPFVVNAAAPEVSWAFVFTPAGGGRDQHPLAGSVTYSYDIPSAGESHAATGSYTLSDPDHDGTRHVALTVRDHVVFKGFDGTMPMQYKFDLVPTTTCAPGT